MNKARAPTALPPLSTNWALRIIVEGLQADDARTEQILREHVQLSEEHWRTHAYSDLHLTAGEGKAVGMINEVKDFVPPRRRVEHHSGTVELGAAWLRRLRLRRRRQAP